MSHIINYEKRFIGQTDMEALILAGDDENGRIKTSVLHFARDPQLDHILDPGWPMFSEYTARFVDGQCEIPSRYYKVFSCRNWIRIYDDWNVLDYDAEYIYVYRSEARDCIIQLIVYDDDEAWEEAWVPEPREMSDRDVLNVIEEAEALPAVLDEIFYLCDRYCISLKDEDGDLKFCDDLVDEIREKMGADDDNEGNNMAEMYEAKYVKMEKEKTAMNGYQMMADSYRKFAKTGDVSREEAEKKIRVYEFLADCDEEDIREIVDSSAVDDIIKAYAALAAAESGADPGSIVDAVTGLFDVMGAERALTAYKKLSEERP